MGHFGAMLLGFQFENYELIKNNKYVDKVVLFPKKKISEIRKFINLINNEKITDIITADRKNRSIFLSFFIKSEIKIFVCVKFIHFLLFKILGKINVFDNEYKVTKIQTNLKRGRIESIGGS